MTNESSYPSPGTAGVFAADKNGKIYQGICSLNSMIAHGSEIEVEEIGCTFQELNPHFFEGDYPNPIINGLIGLALGDAFGVPFEFLSRDEIKKIDISEMVGSDCYLPFASRWNSMIPAGAWSDDTSMTIAAMSSIINKHGEIDYHDIMDSFLLWWEQGEYCSLEFPFGLGTNVSKSLERFKHGVPAPECGGKGFRDNGNGALMRMFPFSMYCILNNYDDYETLRLIKGATEITHGHEINVLGCYIYTQFLAECYTTKNPDLAYQTAIYGMYHNMYKSSFSKETIQAYEIIFHQLNQPDFNVESIPESGYVVDSLAVAIHSVLKTNNFADAIKMAIKAGYDTDTNASITGSIAGVIYGIDQIPARWVSILKKKDELIDIGKHFYEVVQGNYSSGEK